jgi:hypothetical protein
MGLDQRTMPPQAMAVNIIDLYRCLLNLANFASQRSFTF